MLHGISLYKIINRTQFTPLRKGYFFPHSVLKHVAQNFLRSMACMSEVVLRAFQGACKSMKEKRVKRPYTVWPFISRADNEL